MQRDLRPAVLSVLALGAGLSVTANVLAAEPSVVGRSIATWPPIALIITIELIGRVHTRRASISALRVFITWIVGAIAAWLSYGHMRDLAAQHGIGEVAATVLPLTVDGMVIVASLCLMELSDASKPTETPTENHLSPLKENQNAQRIRDLARDNPDWSKKQIAEAIGVSARTVRRYLADATPTA